ncbi:MAG: hypothetical protein ACP5E3_00530, partial [Bacteroidales bacterium]
MGRESGPIPIITINEISEDSINIWLDVKDTVLWFEPVFYQIDNSETFNQLVRSNKENLEFNFEDYTLLIGYFFDIS